MSLFHIHYELLPLDHALNRCDLRTLKSPLSLEDYEMRLLPETMWGTLYIEVTGKMLFQHLTRRRQGGSDAGNAPATGFTCELLEFARTLGSNFASILSGERGVRPAELIGYGVTIWFKRDLEHIRLNFNERRAGFVNVFRWVPIPLEVFVTETHQFLNSIWHEVMRLNPLLDGDPLLIRHLQEAEAVKEHFERGDYKISQPHDRPRQLGTLGR
jgi:hypothetical protein